MLRCAITGIDDTRVPYATSQTQHGFQVSLVRIIPERIDQWRCKFQKCLRYFLFGIIDGYSPMPSNLKKKERRSGPILTS